MDWPEVEKVRKENRRELVLSGDSVLSRITERGLDPKVFSLVNLNFLEISRAALDILPVSVSKLENLTNLGLNGNLLKDLPSSIGQLKKLKFLDLSFNQLECLPDELGTLKELQTLNVNNNKISQFINISCMVQLHSLDLSHNELTELPSGITDEQLALLSTVIAHHNQITSLPTDLFNLATLKSLDVSDNKLEDIPTALHDCGKLKEFKFGGNKLKDKRLAKMGGQCSTKSVLDYLRGIHEKEQKTEGKKSAYNAGEKVQKKKGKQAAGEASKPDHTMKVLHFNNESGLTVNITQEAISVRPFIVCCVVKNLNFFKSRNMMKRFLSLQTKLHDGLCAKRQAATIATHDLETVRGPLKYDARSPRAMMLIPLNKKKEVSAAALVGRLRQEADALRKESKRNAISGIHRYLDLLKDKSAYPCLVDVNDTLISFPPITNCDATKVVSTTRHILIEVTSSTSLDICKKVMEELLKQLLLMGIGQAEEPAKVVVNLDPLSEPASDAVASSDTKSGAEHSKQQNDENEAHDDDNHDGDDDEDDANDDMLALSLSGSSHILVVEQVKVVDDTGILKVVYPARVDLKSELFNVVRDYE